MGIIWASSADLFAQSEYLPGYIVLRDGERREVEILDRDWVDNPRQFRYREDDREVRIGDLTRVREFGYAEGGLRYLRAVVDIDQSSERMDRLSESSEPVFVTDTVFLEFLVDGEADLFYFESGEMKRFFYRQGEDKLAPLINRSFLENGFRVERPTFRGQLRSAINCSTPEVTLRKIAYRRADLVDYFVDYNSCRGASYRVDLRPTNPNRFRVRLRPGVEYYAGPVLFDNGFGGHSRSMLVGTVGPRFGIEVEHILPYANERWALFVEVYYHSLRSEVQQENTRNATVNLRSVNVPLGFRRYLHLSPAKSFFFETGGGFQFPWDSFLSQRTATRVRGYEVSWNFGLFAGAGMNVGRRFSLQFRYLHNSDLLQTYITNSTKLRGYTLVGAYRLR
ncbi:outer membrane beta-barrel protein [Neolewinella litorea]|uniref:outer membrane beta-barrel protein n=1 Tax=Neolewinella litorea TaxID=2562452 RepID=UPI00145602EC|nr:outer membrane beta-barrel protein [Neolewinella litorea]